MDFVKTAAIYHYSVGSNIHPAFTVNRIKAIEEYANSLGYKVITIYRDDTRIRTKQHGLQRFLDECHLYDALFIRSLKHLNPTAMACLTTINKLIDSGITVYTLKNGIFTSEPDITQNPLRVATYFNVSCARLADPEPVIQIQNDILDLYANKKTKWTVLDHYTDVSVRQNKTEQPYFQNLLENKSKYDIVLVHNINDIHERTETFANMREALGLDIYSLEQGLLKFRKEL